VRHASACRGDRPSDRREPPSRLTSPGSASGRAREATSRRGTRVKAVVKILQTLRWRRSESEPASEQTARESGYGSPGRESSGGELQGRERHGTRPRSVGGHGERRGSKDLERAASQLEPSRGARTLRTAPTRVWRSSSLVDDRKEVRVGEGAPDVDSVRGSKNLTRGGPARSWIGPVPS
jgi:hypothetical protein